MGLPLPLVWRCLLLTALALAYVVLLFILFKHLKTSASLALTPTHTHTLAIVCLPVYGLDNKPASCILSNHRSKPHAPSPFDWSFICAAAVKVAPILFVPSFLFPPCPMRARLCHPTTRPRGGGIFIEARAAHHTIVHALLCFGVVLLGPRPRCC